MMTRRRRRRWPPALRVALEEGEVRASISGLPADHPDEKSTPITWQPRDAAASAINPGPVAPPAAHAPPWRGPEQAPPPATAGRSPCRRRRARPPHRVEVGEGVARRAMRSTAVSSSSPIVHEELCERGRRPRAPARKQRRLARSADDIRRPECRSTCRPTMAVGDRKEPKSNTFVSLRQTLAPRVALHRGWNGSESARTRRRLYRGWSRCEKRSCWRNIRRRRRANSALECRATRTRRADGALGARAARPDCGDCAVRGEPRCTRSMRRV